MALLGVLLLFAGCNLSDVTSPNDPQDLTGQNPNEDADFKGSVRVLISGTQEAADGVTDVIITAVARDRDGNPVQNGTPITFTTDLGQLRPSGTSPLSGSSSVTVVSFSGRASVLLRSGSSGTATVRAIVGDESDFVQVSFTAPPLEGTLELTIEGTAKTKTFSAPADVELEAVAVDDDGVPLVGVRVRFRIVRDLTLGSGLGQARFLGQGSSLTDQLGRATEVLRVEGEGEVVVEAELEDPNTGSVVAISNQVIVVTDEVAKKKVDLTFADGSQSFSATAPFSVGLEATVTDEDDEPLVAARVRFRIIEETDPDTADLANSGSTNTDSAGMAFNTLNVDKVGQATVIAELLDDGGSVVATSNQVVATGE